MDTIIGIGGALLGVALGVGVAWALARVVRSRGSWLFWVVATAAFVVGIAVIAAGIGYGAEVLVWGGSAFALTTVTALKWTTGRVPGVSIENTSEDESSASD